MMLGVLLVLAQGFAVAPPPAEAGRLRDVVWPVLATAPAGDAGLLWATEPGPERVVLHRGLVATGRVVEAEVVLAGQADEGAVAEAVRLRLAWLLEVPPDRGAPWSPPEPPLPPPARPLPDALAAELALRRPAGLPAHQTRVPVPAGLRPAVDGRRREFGVEAPSDEVPEGTVWLRLGADGLADAGGASPGFGLEVAVQVGDDWQVGARWASHPFEDFRRGGRLIGVTGSQAGLQAAWRVWSAPPWQVAATGGAFFGTLSTVGGGEAEGWQLGLTAGGAAELALAGPFHLRLGAELQAAPTSTEARLGDEVLRRRGPVGGRASLAVGWALW